MPIAVFFVIFAGSVVIAVLYPHLRAIAVLISLLCGALLGYLYVDQSGRDLGHTRDITLEEVTLSDIEVAETSRFLQIDGRVMNGSESFRLSEFTLEAKLFDCPTAESPHSECAVIAQEDGIARVAVPPGQTRGFEAVISLVNHLPAKGVLIWDYAVSNTRGQAARQ